MAKQYRHISYSAYPQAQPRAAAVYQLPGSCSLESYPSFLGLLTSFLVSGCKESAPDSSSEETELKAFQIKK